MILKRYLLLSLLPFVTIYFVGCVIEKTKGGLHIYQKSNLLNTPNGYCVGKHKKFKLKDKFQLPDTSILSSNFLYINKNNKESWFKFYKNGKVVLGFNSKIPLSDYDKIWGWGGYYKIDGTTITIEMSYTQDSYQWSNLYITGKIFGDTLKFYKDRYIKTGSNIHHFTSEKNHYPPPDSHYYILGRDSFKLKEPDW
jgi:hypothetical protein